MGANYRMMNLPEVERLPPGTYSTRVKNAYWEGKELIIELVYSPDTPVNDCLFTFTVPEP